MPGAGDPQSLNRYAYTLNNPVKYVDPTGHIGLLPAILLGIAAVAVLAGTAFETVEGAKIVYGEATIQASNTVNDAAQHPMGGGTPFEPIALRAAINMQKPGMLYDDIPGTASRGLGAVRLDLAQGLVPDMKLDLDQIQNDHVLNVRLRAGLMARELAKCSKCSKTDQYIVLALAQNDTFVADGFLKEGWDAMLKNDDKNAGWNGGPKDPKDWAIDKYNKLTHQGWEHGRMHYELSEFAAQLRMLQSQGWQLPKDVNLNYIECLGNGGNTSSCSR